MSQQKYLLFGIVLILVLGITPFLSTLNSLDNNNTLYQISTINYLSSVNFDGKFSTSSLKEYGDTGLGTFNGLDGEMIELDDVIYQIKSSGTVIRVNGPEMVPFAMVTKFTPDKVILVNRTMNYTELESYLNATVPSKNLVYSFKIMGHFNYIKARSPQEQSKPYLNLTEALKNQSIFNLNDVNGTIVGFWCPESASSINNNDYHFHFINIQKNSGGHVLDLNSGNVLIEIDYIPDIYLSSAQNKNFTKFNLNN